MSLIKSFVKSRNAYKVTFMVPQNSYLEGREIRLLGEFNNWNWDNAPSLKQSNGSYKVVVELSAGQSYQYRYLVDQSEWINDNIADSYTPSPYANVDNCVVSLDQPVALVQKSTKTKSKVDFRKIEGVGPKIASLLHDAGFKSYEELAGASKEELESILAVGGKKYQMHDPTTWPKQSDLLAKSDLVKLKKLQAELKGGRKK